MVCHVGKGSKIIEIPTLFWYNVNNPDIKVYFLEHIGNPSQRHLLQLRGEENQEKPDWHLPGISHRCDISVSCLP